jgi:hypothetical protein
LGREGVDHAQCGRTAFDAGMIWYFNCLAVSLDPLNLDSGQLVNKNSPTPDFLSIYFNFTPHLRNKKICKCRKNEKTCILAVDLPKPRP